MKQLLDGWFFFHLVFSGLFLDDFFSRQAGRRGGRGHNFFGKSMEGGLKLCVSNGMIHILDLPPTTIKVDGKTSVTTRKGIPTRPSFLDLRFVANEGLFLGNFPSLKKWW